MALDQQLPDLDPNTLDDNDALFAIIEQFAKSDPMQARWQQAIWRHQAQLRAMATEEVMIEHDRVMMRMAAKEYDLVLMITRWAYEAGRRSGRL